ncbi:MAG TPA: 4Fe-4S ferredoxin [Proteobacteria bacterium]|nr:4Fe-4S ferredoxin [Pseudomonadota bacterium]
MVAVEELKRKVEALFDEGRISRFLGFKSVAGRAIPYLFSKDELADLAFSNERYPVAIIMDALNSKSDEPVGVLVRACDERAIVEHIKNNKLDKDRVVLVGVACDEQTATECRCPRPYPSVDFAGERVDVEPDRSRIEAVEKMSYADRLKFWSDWFSRCLKCYGCRNICPMCFCTTCSLEDEKLGGRFDVPPAFPAWHLIRAFHMIGRCVDCGLCELVCPASIPLRTIYKKVREISGEVLDYLPGEQPDAPLPLEVLGDGTYELPPDMQEEG